jgi:hypothetical protein
MTGQTGQTCTVSVIYQSQGCHSVQRSVPKGHEFPPCAHCRKAVTWVLVQAAHTR